MPYANIVWVKVHLNLLDGDDRFLYQITERQQLLYLKMLILAGKTNNATPKNPVFIANAIHYPHGDQELTLDISRLMEVFPKFTQTKHHYIFTNFDKIHNRISEGTPKELPRDTQRGVLDKSREEKIRVDKRETFKPPTLEELKAYQKERKADIDTNRFFNFYESKGWLVGKNKMKDWRAAFRNWEKDKEPKRSNIEHQRTKEYLASLED